MMRARCWGWNDYMGRWGTVAEVEQKTRVVFEPHEDDQWYDEMRVRCVERWKESEMSGDEWRFSYYVEFLRKADVLVSRTFSRWEWAMAYVPSLALNDYPGGADEEHQEAPVIKHRYEFCFQPGCPELATREFRLIKLYAPRSGQEIPKSLDADHRMRFCYRHAGQRGDGGLMDADANLVEVPFGSDGDAGACEFPMAPRRTFSTERGDLLVCPHPACAVYGNQIGWAVQEGGFVWELPLARSIEDRENLRAEIVEGHEVWLAHMGADHGLDVKVGTLDG